MSPDEGAGSEIPVIELWVNAVLQIENWHLTSCEISDFGHEAGTLRQCDFRLGKAKRLCYTLPRSRTFASLVPR
jgi:hypothetical protein